MFSAEEEDAQLAKIPSGGELVVTLYAISIDAANPKWLTYIVCNSNGDVLERQKGHRAVPSARGEFRWVAFDAIELPAFADSLRVRVYHELFGSLGDYTIPRNGQPVRLQ